MFITFVSYSPLFCYLVMCLFYFNARKQIHILYVSFHICNFTCSINLCTYKAFFYSSVACLLPFADLTYLPSSGIHVQSILSHYMQHNVGVQYIYRG